MHVVGIDNAEFGRMAARTLLRRGYRRIGFLGGPIDATSTIDRRAGFREVLHAAPGVTQTETYATAYFFEAGRDEMHRLLQNPLAEAYFCGDDVLSIGAISALQGKGIAVPGGVGIIGLNDMENAGWGNINLTTIRQPIPQIVEATTELISAMLDEPNRHPEARLKMSIAARPCRPPSGS